MNTSLYKMEDVMANLQGMRQLRAGEERNKMDTGSTGLNPHTDTQAFGHFCQGAG